MRLLALTNVVESLPHCVEHPSVIVCTASLNILWESCIGVFLHHDFPPSECACCAVVVGHSEFGKVAVQGSNGVLTCLSSISSMPSNVTTLVGCWLPLAAFLPLFKAGLGCAPQPCCRKVPPLTPAQGAPLYIHLASLNLL